MAKQKPKKKKKVMSFDGGIVQEYHPLKKKKRGK